MKQHPTLLALTLCIGLCVSWATPSAGAEQPSAFEPTDSLLQRYAQADRDEKPALGRKLIDIFDSSDAFLDDKPQLQTRMPEDSIDLVVYYAANRFYVINAYYTEALSYNQRAMDCGSKQHPDIHATLLCDRGYCLYKTGQLAQATQAEQEAVDYSKQQGNLLQLSRAYLYLAIINVSISQENRPQAKQFIEKAIETNKQLGMNRQMHNTLGVACEIFCSAGEVDKAIQYGQQAVEAAEAIGYTPGVANHLSQLSYAYNRNKQFQKGLEAAQQAIDMVLAMDIPDRNLLAISMEYKGWNLLDMGHNAEAAKVLQQAAAIEQEIGNTRAVCYDMRVICEALEPIDPAGALKALKRYSAMADSMHTAQLQEALGQANASFRNDELQAENDENRRTNRIILLAALAIGLLLTATIAALWFGMRQKSKANRTLQKLQQIHEDFFTNVTHEFRTPLTIILGMSRKLQGNARLDDNETAQAAAMIERQGERLLGLVNQLLDIAKVKSAVGNQVWQHGNIMAYITMIAETYREVGRSQGISLQLHTEPQLLQTDFVPDYLQKLLGNLIANAFKFTPEGGTVQVNARRKGGQLLLTVSDSGSGIAPEHLPHLFEPFYQADSTGARSTGVGLTLVKQIVESLGGQVTACSTLGQGATFTVQLPLQTGHAAAASTTAAATDFTVTATPAAATAATTTTVPASAGAAPSTDVPSRPTQHTTRPSVLIVEDDADVATYIRDVLHNYDTLCASDGEAGLALAREQLPDIILTDLMMPHTDGLELCRQIRADQVTNHIPIVVITAKASDDDRLAGIHAGADAYLSKPFRSDELTLRIDKLLAQRALLHQKYANEWKDALLEAEQTEAEGASTLNAQQFTPPRQLATQPESNGHDERQAETGVMPSAAANQMAASTAETPPQRTDAEAQFLAELDERIKALMTANQADIEHVASSFCMSPSQFRRKLNAITGATPAQYILHIRMEEARRLLRERPDRTIIDIAEQCGFANQAHFTRVFNRLYGTTPGQWRRGEAED